MATTLTVFGALKHLFPADGNLPRFTPMKPIDGFPLRRGLFRSKEERACYGLPPLHPFDLFAIAGYLLERSGAYHHVVPNTHPVNPNDMRDHAGRMLVVSKDDLDRCCGVAAIWRKGPRQTRAQMSDEDLAGFSKQLKFIFELWSKLFGSFGDRPLFKETDVGKKPPGWWDIALKLFIIADEAARGTGFHPVITTGVDAPQPHWFERGPFYEWLAKQFPPEPREAPPHDDDEIKSETEAIEGIPTLSAAQPDVVCVLPKARTTAVGCTLRSLSHHLALLPPQGIARARWMPQLFHQGSDDNAEFNILLVPFPFSANDRAFKARRRGGDGHAPVNFFTVDQTWLPRSAPRSQRLKYERLLIDMERFIHDLDRAARNQGAQSINAVIFPELALDYEMFDWLQTRLTERLTSLELLIAGVSSNAKGEHGNFVAVASYERATSTGAATQGKSRKSKSVPPLFIAEQVREKHHRWKLGRMQIEDYGLTGALNPANDWWEDVDLLSRRVDFTVFRRSSVIAAMICEDLARVDPCQQLLRAIGPNIVVSLLMDAPQYKTRWPARYASVLADDPGSAVLTLTSRALMTHQHHSVDRFKSQGPEDRVIALWRDEFFGRFEQIACPKEAHGVWLKVWSRPVTDITIDGRDDSTAVSWHYGSQTPLVIPNVDDRYASLLGPEDCKLRPHSKP